MATQISPGENKYSFFFLLLTAITSYMQPVSKDDIEAGKTWGDLVCVVVELIVKHKLEHGQTPAQAKQLFSALIALLGNLL